MLVLGEQRRCNMASQWRIPSEQRWVCNAGCDRDDASFQLISVASEIVQHLGTHDDQQAASDMSQASQGSAATC